MKLITIDTLLNHAKENASEKINIEIKELGGILEFDKVDRALYLDMMAGDEKDRDAELIYNCCKMFRDNKLIEKLNCTHNPTEVVGKILSGATIYKLSNAILEASGYKIDSDDAVKIIKSDIKNS